MFVGERKREFVYEREGGRDRERERERKSLCMREKEGEREGERERKSVSVCERERETIVTYQTKTKHRCKPNNREWVSYL